MLAPGTAKCVSLFYVLTRFTFCAYPCFVMFVFDTTDPTFVTCLERGGWRLGSWFLHCTQQVKKKVHGHRALTLMWKTVRFNIVTSLFTFYLTKLLLFFLWPGAKIHFCWVNDIVCLVLFLALGSFNVKLAKPAKPLDDSRGVPVWKKSTLKWDDHDEWLCFCFGDTLLWR